MGELALTPRGTRSHHSNGAPASIDVCPEFPALADEWEALAERIEAPPFLRPGWFSAWWTAFGSGRLELIAARRDGRLCGVLPMASAGGKLSSLANWHTPWFSPIAEDADIAGALLETPLGQARRRVDLPFVEAEDPAVLSLRESARRAGWRTVLRVIERSPYVILEGDWESFEAQMPGKRRRDLRRRYRRLAESGAVSFQSHRGPERLDELVAEGLAIEASGWKGRRGTAISAEDHTRLFYEQAARWAAGPGWLRLCFLRVGGRGVAFAFCMADARAHYVLKVGFDPAFASYAPGLLLTRQMIAEAFQQGLERYEFLGAADPYKLIWTDRFHELARLQLFPQTPIGMIEYLAWTRGRPLAKRVLSR